jgi:hypothetical protein
MTKGILWAVLQQPISVLPIFSNGKPHHITMFYDVDKTQYQHLIGTELRTFSYANCTNDRIQALLCYMPPYIPHKPNPHITISYEEGVSPSASNEMLLGDHMARPLVLDLKLKIEFFEFPICDHHWVKNGTRKGVQQWICKHCGKSRSGNGTVKRGRPFKQI